MTTAVHHFDIYIGETEHGTHLAATNESPYFCLEAESEEALIAKVEAALAFLSANRHRAVPGRAQTPLTSFLPKKVVSSADLASAA
jgi:hypothetical protein